MSHSSKNWVIPESIEIPYGAQKRNLRQKFRKILNTILQKLAYDCPINALRCQFHRWRGCHIGEHVYIGMYCIFDNLAPQYIYMCDGSAINANGMILTHFNPLERFKPAFESSIRPVVIREKAMVSIRNTIMPGVYIGVNAVTGVGMVIDKDVPDYALVREKKKRELVDLTFLYNKN